MEIVTEYGSIDYDDLEDFDLSKETLEFIENQKSAAEIFFSSEIDLTDDRGREFKDQIQEIAEVAIAENKYTEPAKAFALSEYLDEPITDIEEVSYSSDNFEVGSSEYVVFTDDEADDAALEAAKNLIDDIGIDGLNDQEYIYSNFVETKWFDEAMEEYNSSYAYDIKEESSSDDDTYVNRLHEEMVERGIMDAPEWPGDSDEFDFEREYYEREEFSDEEPDPNDYDDDNQNDYEEDAQAWADAEVDWENEQDRLEAEWEEEQDRLEEENDEKMEAAADDYRTDLESEVENNIDTFAEKLSDDYENGIDYWEQHFGKEDVARVAKEQGLIDTDAVVEWIAEEDSRGSLLNHYDGGEDSITITFRKDEYEFYIYQVA